MTEFTVTIRCPQTHRDCNGKLCRKKKSKGCSVELLNIWLIEAENREHYDREDLGGHDW